MKRIMEIQQIFILKIMMKIIKKFKIKYLLKVMVL